MKPVFHFVPCFNPITCISSDLEDGRAHALKATIVLTIFAICNFDTFFAVEICVLHFMERLVVLAHTHNL